MNAPDGIDVEQAAAPRQLDSAESYDDIVEDGESVRLKHLKQWPPVNINFQDITQTVPDVTCGE